jgi:hypothetical protein
LAKILAKTFHFRYVTEWLLGAVAGHDLVTGAAGVKRVRKKIRDEVLWKKGSLLPWRRSGEYMAVKIVLHSTLMGGALGESDGQLAYKLIILKLMSTCLQHHSFAKLDTDVILQMLSKVARRISKLEELAKQRPAIHPSLHRCIQRTLKEICELVIDVRGKVDERWQSIMKQEAEDSAINVDKSKLDFEGDLRHSFRTAWPHLQVALSLETLPCTQNIFNPPRFTRNRSREWLDMTLLDHGTDSWDAIIPFHDIEVWVRDVLFLELQGYTTDRPETKLFKLLEKYINRAKRVYEGDCLGSSRMILTATTIVAVLDRLAGREFPLLHEYDAAVDISVLEFLLLPHRHDMEHLTKLEAYFARRLDNRMVSMSLISEDEPSSQSFAVRQAQRDREVARRKEEILEFARHEKLKKLEELSTARAKYNNLIRTARARSCDVITDVDGDTCHLASYCKKCKLESQADQMRVSVFEFPLPETTHLQDAVVGELVAPTSSWTTLRDALHVLHRDMLNVQLQSCEKKGTWRSYEPLQRWVRTPSESPLITLGSTNKLFVNSHYRSWHPSQYPDQDFFKPNGFNLRLMEHSSDKLASTITYEEPHETVRSRTTLDADGAYMCLQWTMGGTSHTENEVLCKQVDCPPELNLAEFNAFGTLRAGQRIQIRNLVRVLEMRTLSLSQPSVVNLISQALWETGPPNETVWFRDTQLDFRDEAFARYTLGRLHFLTGNVGDNWKDHLALLSIVTVGARVLAMSEAAWEIAAMDVLLKCREIAEKWLKQIEEALGGMMASPIHEIQRMRSKLVDVAAIAALTLDVDVRHLESLAMKSNEDVIYWLRALARIYDNVLLNSESAVTRFQRNLLRRVQLTALRLEKALQRHLKQHGDCLDGFVRCHWADATQGHTELPWTHYDSPGEHWWTTTFKHDSFDGHKSTLHVDTLRGSFLVNGLPVGRLPCAITSHEDYARVFGCHVFEVQPAAASAGTFVSVYKLKDSVFTFDLKPGNRLVVKDRRHDNDEYELFPSRFFGGDLPSLLIQNYSHWIIVPKTKRGSSEQPSRILFRPVKFDGDHFADDVVPFEINARSVQDTQRDRKLVDICSTSFTEVYDGVLHRLELPSYVHVFVNSNSGDVHAELPRMGLSFHIKEGVLWSREQPGFKVSENQSLGTLIGLRQGVLLIEQDSKVPGKDIIPLKRSLVMPHTMALSIKMEMRPKFGQRHPVVQIQDFQFSPPSFFVYDMDDRLHCLQAPASQAAWLYLALLHALTAHPLPDPFTGLTGAESAMRLLQSPRCWSCKPYDHISLSILQNIEKLAPRREWYPKHLQCMQTVSWPEGLFPSTALDAFRIIVEKLIEGSKQLSVLFPGSGESKLPAIPTESSNLRWKSYWRSRSFHGQETLMSSKFEGVPPDLCFTTMNLSEEEAKNLKEEYKAMRALAEVGFQWRSARCEPWPMMCTFGVELSSSLLNRESLSGATRKEFLTGQSTVSAWRKLAVKDEVGKDFADNWINLYNLARQVRMPDRRQEFTFLLSLLAFRDVNYQLLFLLLFVAVHANDFKGIDPPESESYELTNQVDLDLTMVKAEIKRHTVPFDDWKQSYDAKLLKMQYRQGVESLDDHWRRAYRQRQAQDVESLVGITQSSWRFSPNTAISSTLVSATIECREALDGVSKLFTRWLHNRQLHSFVSSVKAKIDVLISNRTTRSLQPGPLELPIVINAASSTAPFCCKLPITPSKLLPQEYSDAEAIFQEGQFGKSMIERKEENQKAVIHHDPHPSFLEANRTSSACQVSEVFKADLRNSWDQRYELQAPPSVGVDILQLAEKLEECKRKSSSLWKGIHDVVMPCEEDLTSRALEAAGLWRRVTPAVLLPLLVSPAAGEAHWTSVRMALGALAVIWTLEQQAERCLRFFGTNDVALQKELANTSPRTWKPFDRPEWLLLELEGDYRMRKVQVDVTNTMLEAKDGQNAVLQLNMGEGKSSVIVPALCASISDGAQFARLTVLSSLFRINFDALAFKLGGLLNRRAYTFPCCRDMKLSAGEVARMERAYRDCIAERGVVVTRPEHRLSAQLMSLELCRAGQGYLRNLLEFVNSKAGDVLDESDLILQVKYQVTTVVAQNR